MDLNNPVFKKYVAHVLKWEGLTSKDPDDTQAKCAPFPGAYHTNKGVTYCTFKENAARLGVVPVNYERFLALSDDDIAKFVLLFMQKAEADSMPTEVALSVTEAAWMSGVNRAVKHLQTALNKLGQPVTIDGDIGNGTRIAAARVKPEDLYGQYWVERKKFLDSLTATAKYAKWKNGWNNRMRDFLKIFPVAATIGAVVRQALAPLIDQAYNVKKKSSSQQQR